MPRLVDARKHNGASAALLPASDGDGREALINYLERVAKYVPVEIVAVFLAIRGIWSATVPPGSLPAALEIALFATLVACTPVYLLEFGGTVPRKGAQIFVATLSFVIWAYAIGGPFFWPAIASIAQHNIVHPSFAGAFVVLWSLLIGLFRPEAASATAALS